MRKPVQTVGAVFAVIALTLLLVAITTSNWVNIEISRDSEPALTGGGLATYSRHRGIYKECWTNKAVESAIGSNDYRYGNSKLCLSLDLKTWDTSRDTYLTMEYKVWQGLLVGMLAMLGVSALFTFLALVFFSYTMCHHVNNYEWKSGCKASAGLMLAAVLFNVLGMGLYHGAENVERNTVTDNSMELQAPYESFYMQDQSQDLINRTNRMYSWGYALSWCAVACELLAAVLFMAVSCCYVKSTKSKSLVYAKPKQTTVVVGQRNPAYEMVQEKVVMAPPKVYVVESDYHQDGRGGYDPYSHGQPQNGYSPSYDYDKGWDVQ